MSEASQDITQQFINGGVIPGALNGQSSASKKYVDDQNAIQNVQIAAVGGAASNAQIEVDTLEVRVDNIVAYGGNSNIEIVDARGTYPVLSARLNASDAQFADLAYLKAENRNILTVAKIGGQFTTINDAIDYAKTYCSVSNRVTITVAAGNYEEEIILMPNPGIDIIGSGCDSTTVTYSSVYPNAPIYTVGKGYFQDIGFTCSASGNNSYAFHFESQTNPATGFIKFVNCTFLSLNNSGVGIGLGQDTGVQFVGCDIASIGYPPLYAHNYPADNVTGQLLELRNTKISGYGTLICARIDDAAKLSSHSNSIMSITVANCESSTPNIEFVNGSTLLTYFPKTGTDITLSKASTNTNILGLHYTESEITVGGIIFVDGQGYFTVATSNALLRNYTVTSAVRADDYTDIASTLTFVAAGDNYIIFATSDTTVRQHAVNINVKGTAK